MKAFFVVSCLVLAATAKTQGYSYDKPSNDGLSVALLLPPADNQHIQTSLPALSAHFASSQSTSQRLAPVSSHGSLGLGSHSSGGSLSLGSSYAVSQGPTINTFGGHSFGSGHSSSGSFSSGSSSSFGSGSGFSGVVAQAPVAPSTFIQAPAAPTFVSAPAAPSFVPAAPTFVSAPAAPKFVSAPAAPSFVSAPAAPSFVSAPAAPSFVPAQAAPSFVPAPAAPSFVSAPATSTLVQKHIYVHVPPPEEEELSAPQQPSVVNKQKHYKIIFIKAPSAPSVSQQLVQAQLAQQQSEEKTLVYVLVKKPESLEELQNTIARAPLPQPSKPEVYFIKYKAQTAGGFSAPVPLAQPIALPPGVSGQTSEYQLGHSASSGSASSISSASSVAAVDTSSHATSASHATTVAAVDTSSSVASSQNIAKIASVIQPRNPDDDGHVPAAEYGPPKQ